MLAAAEELLATYIADRTAGSGPLARTRLRARLHLRYAGDELVLVMRRLERLARFNIRYLSTLGRLACRAETPWLAAALLVLIASLVWTAVGSLPYLGLCLGAGATAQALFASGRLVADWCQTGVLIAIYRELAEFLAAELAGA